MQGSTFLMQRSRDFTLQHQKVSGRLDRLELTGVLAQDTCRLQLTCHSHRIHYTLSSPNRNQKCCSLQKAHWPTIHSTNQETEKPSVPPVHSTQHCSLQPCICSLSASCFASCCAASSKRRASTRAWCFWADRSGSNEFKAVSYLQLL